jgi:hypothetical protein
LSKHHLLLLLNGLEPHHFQLHLHCAVHRHTVDMTLHCELGSLCLSLCLGLEEHQLRVLLLLLEHVAADYASGHRATRIAAKVKLVSDHVGEFILLLTVVGETRHICRRITREGTANSSRLRDLVRD